MCYVCVLVWRDRCVKGNVLAVRVRRRGRGLLKDLWRSYQPRAGGPPRGSVQGSRPAGLRVLGARVGQAAQRWHRAAAVRHRRRPGIRAGTRVEQGLAFRFAGVRVGQRLQRPRRVRGRATRARMRGWQDAVESEDSTVGEAGRRPLPALAAAERREGLGALAILSARSYERPRLA